MLNLNVLSLKLNHFLANSKVIKTNTLKYLYFYSTLKEHIQTAS